MNPRVKLAAAVTPGGGEIVLYRHDHDYAIRVDGQELMNSRQHESELELARLGCAHLTDHDNPRVLVGGLGMGYTLRQVLDMLGPQGHVVVGELMGAVVEWNHTYFGELNGRPLGDARVELAAGDIVALIERSPDRFDAILLDIDNGPRAMTDSGNRRLYVREGMLACRRALRGKGCLAVWSAAPSKKFEHLLMACDFHVRRFRAQAYRGSKSPSRFVWVASEDKRKLPAGGGEPRPPRRKMAKQRSRRTRRRR